MTSGKQRSSQTNCGSSRWLETTLTCIAPVTDSGAIWRAEKGREIGRWLRRKRTTRRFSRWIYRTRRAWELRHLCGEGRDAVAMKWFISGTNLRAVGASGCGEDLGIGVAVNGSRRWSSKVARRRGLIDALSPMRRGRKTKMIFPSAAIKRSGTLCWALAWLDVGRAGGLRPGNSSPLFFLLSYFFYFLFCLSNLSFNWFAEFQNQSFYLGYKDDITGPTHNIR
jgi:hypothetical protein